MLWNKKITNFGKGKSGMFWKNEITNFNVTKIQGMHNPWDGTMQ